MQEIMDEIHFFTLIYFFYGLAFFSMGLAVFIQGDRSTDERLRLSLRPLVAFGLLHGARDWLDMFEVIGMVGNSQLVATVWYAGKLAVLSFSFLSLAGFGFSLISPTIQARRLTLLAPLVLAAVWAFGLWILNDRFDVYSQVCQIPCVWTRYSLGIPSALAASIGLIVQQRAFRRSGMVKFGRDSLAAAIAFAWYGLVGQLFVPASRLAPSTYVNQELFLSWFGFPIQVLRAVLAVLIAIFVIRFMRAFDTEIQGQIEELRAARLEEIRQREALRGGLIKRIVAAQESERQRIARELHDDTGQALTAIGLGLQGVTKTIGRDPKNAELNLNKLKELSSSALDELQRIISNLRPSHLDDLGLAAAIRWYINDVRNHTEMEMSFHQEGEEVEVADESKIAIYRVIQEAITNAIKYSQGTRILVGLAYLDSGVSVFIEDNGIGLDPELLKNKRGQSWGLIGMRERAELLDGTCSIESGPNMGVLVRLKIPYQLTTNNEDVLEVAYD